MAPTASPSDLPRLNLLGVPHWSTADGDPRRDLPSNVPGFLLAVLALRGDWITREALAALFWPERPESEAQHNLRVNLHRLKRLLTDWGLQDRLHAEQRRVRVALPTDLHALRAAAGRADRAALRTLAAQPLLDGLALNGFPSVLEWLDNERAALATLLERHGGADGGAGPPAPVVPDADRQPPAAPHGAYRAHGDDWSAPVRVSERAAAYPPAHPPVQPSPHPPARDSARAAGPAHGPAPAPAPARAQPPRLAQPPWTGRSADLARVQRSAARVLVVEGEPGLGKTRLLEQACPGAVWLTCRADRTAQPLAALAEYLEDMQDTLSAHPQWPRWRADLAHLVPAVLPGQQPAPLPSRPAGLPQLLRTAAALLRAVAPVLVVDDLQWADAALLQLLQALVHEGPPLRATLRPAQALPSLLHWLDAVDAERLPLPPWSPEEVQDLLHALGADQAPRFAAWLHQRSGGNPYLALETLRALFDGGQLQAGLQGWHSALDRLAEDYGALALPPRLWALVERRLAALAHVERQVLAVAALAGDARHPGLLAAVAGLPPLAVGQALAQAQAAGLLRGRAFAHELVREALLRSLPEPVAQVLHAALAHEGAGLLPPQRLARHAWAADDEALAVRHTLDAAALDRRRGLHATASDTLTQALDRCASGAHRAGLLAALARVALECNDLEAAAERAAAALAALPAPGVRLATLVLRGEIALQQGALAQAQTEADAAAEIDPGDPALLTLQGRLAFEAGDFDATVAVLQRLLPRLRREAPGEALVAALTQLGAAHDGAGRTEAGLACHREALALARALHAPHAQVDATLNLLWSLPDLGRHEEAIALGREALALGQFDGTPALMNNLAFLYWDLGRFDEAEPLYVALSEGADPTVRCFAWAKRVALAARRGDTPALDAAVHAALDALVQTELYRAHAVVMVAVLTHGRGAAVQRALAAWRPQQPLDPALQAQLQQALQRHGVAT